MDRPFYRQIALEPLGAAEIRELGRDLLGDHSSVAELPNLIGEQTGGNPFFVEEAIRALAESGRLVGERGAYRVVEPLAELGVPDSVQAILAARIDRLPERDKHVLQTAAVIGKEFRGSVLASVAELPPGDLAAALSELREGEFIYEQALYPEAEYAFRHPLTQEVAYDSQLRDRRARLHAEVAREMEARSADGSDDHAPLIAHHWECAGEALAAANWCARAAQRVGGSNPGGARDYWRRVVALLEDEPESVEVGDLLLEACKNILLLSFLAGVSSDETTSVYFRARMLAEERDDTRSLAFIASMYGLLIGTSTGDVRASLRHSQEAWELGMQTGDQVLLLMISLTLMSALTFVGRLDEAQQICRTVLEGGPEDPALAELYRATVFFTHARAHQARLIGDLGEPREALARLEAVLPDVRQRGGVLLEGIVHQWRALLLSDLGEADAIMEEAREALALADRIGAPYLEAQALFILGLAHEAREAWAESAEGFERSLAVMKQSRTGIWDQPHALFHLAIAQAGLGEFERARATAAGALERARQIGCTAEGPWFGLARVGILAGDPPDEVEQAIHGFEAEMAGRDNPVRSAAACIARADLAARRGDPESESLQLREAERFFEECGATKRARAVTQRLAALQAE